ncbi:uncharacterized protein LOC141655453 [Silene latifolia]|uniref:uncharacterized protein LOC141655453 n=1 Tax=Silene latifolia TaxID=37657 RepID=UPI003D77CBC7
MPFRYLGVPVQPTRLTKQECSIRIEKMVSKIRNLGARKLSYAELKPFVITICGMEALNFIVSLLLPGVLLRSQNKRGGLGIKKADIWNIATVAKLAYWIYSKADRLWVRWVHQVYLEGSDWNSYKPPQDVSWTWKNICKVKDIMSTGYINGQWQHHEKGYTIRSGYEWLRAKDTKKPWYNQVWNQMNIPKHSLITWMAMNKGMNVKDKLFKIGCCQDDKCLLCDLYPETVDHLFFDCPYSRQIIRKVETWCESKIPFQNAMLRCSRKKGSTLKRKMIAMILNACYYQVCHQRNSVRVNQVMDSPEIVLKKIKEECWSRIKGKILFPVVGKDEKWMDRLMVR